MSDAGTRDDGTDRDPRTGLPDALPGGPDDDPGNRKPLVEDKDLDEDEDDGEG